VEPHVWSNLVVAALVLGAIASARMLRRSDLWRAAARDLLWRRPIALATIGAFVAIALLDSIAWVGGGGGDASTLEENRPRSIVDRMFAIDFKEKSYSAPLADAEFYGGSPLAHPGAHLLGTCRMGDDPATSVVDKFHRTHDVPNLFLCDGSSFVTSGRGQPTMTIMALAFRASEHIMDAARKNEI